MPRTRKQCVLDFLLCLLLAGGFLCSLSGAGAEEAQKPRCVSVAHLSQVEGEQVVLSAHPAHAYLNAIGIIAVRLDGLVLWPDSNGVVLFGLVGECVAWRIIIPIAAHKSALDASRGQPVNN